MTRIVVSVVGKWVKVFQKRHEVEPDPKVGVEDSDEYEGQRRIGFETVWRTIKGSIRNSPQPH